MAQYRYLQCSYWTDPFILGLTPEEKFFYIYLMTNPHTRQCGCYEISPGLMQLETGYNQDTLSKLILRFIDYGKIKFDDTTDEIFVVNWLKHNTPNSQPVIKCIVRELSTIKSVDFKQQIIEILHKKGYALDTPSIPPTGHTIKELKELKEKELKEKGQAPSSGAIATEHQNRLREITTPTAKRKTNLNPEQLEQKITLQLAAIAEQQKIPGHEKFVADLQLELEVLQSQLKTA